MNLTSRTTALTALLEQTVFIEHGTGWAMETGLPVVLLCVEVIVDDDEITPRLISSHPPRIIKVRRRSYR